MITLREAVRALLIVAFVIVAAWIGRWLEVNDPRILSTWRFLNGLVILFLIVVHLWKWEQLRGDLADHRGEILQMVQGINTFMRESEQARTQQLDLLMRDSQRLAENMAARAEEASRKRHEALGERLEKVTPMPRRREEGDR
jgi:4-amino-4-deoxy-L-arabinose transferase-like glycosyltransferase